MFFFFFKQKTAYEMRISDWSSDVCSSDLDLVNLENIGSLKVDFRVPEIHALRLATGQPIRVALDAIPNASFDGKVYAIDPAHDPNGQIGRASCRERVCQYV